MSKSSKVESYQGKQVFVGIDVHKRTYAIASFMDGLVNKKWTTPASPEKLVVQLKALYPQADIHNGSIQKQVKRKPSLRWLEDWSGSSAPRFDKAFPID